MKHWVVLLFAAATTFAAAPKPDEALAWNDKGLAAAALGNYAEAQQNYLKAVEQWTASGPDYEPHLAISLVNLGQAYCSQGKRHEGAQVFEEALAKLRRTFGARSEWTLTTMNLLAAVHLMLGEPERAEPLLREALPIERELFPNDVNLSRTLQGLTTIALNHNQPDEALTLSEEALKVSIAAEPDSIDTAMAYATVAEVHRISHRGERALPLYRKSRAIYEKLLGPGHPRVASVLSQEGLVLMNDGKLSLAEKAMLRSLEILNKSCPGCTHEFWVDESNLGLLRYKQKRYAEADVLLTHALEIQEKYMPHPNQDLAGTIQALAATREKLRRFDDAARLSQRAKTIMSSFR